MILYWEGLAPGKFRKSVFEVLNLVEVPLERNTQAQDGGQDGPLMDACHWIPVDVQRRHLEGTCTPLALLRSWHWEFQCLELPVGPHDTPEVPPDPSLWISGPGGIWTFWDRARRPWGSGIPFDFGLIATKWSGSTLLSDKCDGRRHKL